MAYHYFKIGDDITTTYVPVDKATFVDQMWGVHLKINEHVLKESPDGTVSQNEHPLGIVPVREMSVVGESEVPGRSPSIEDEDFVYTDDTVERVGDGRYTIETGQGMFTERQSRLLRESEDYEFRGTTGEGKIVVQYID